MPPEDGPLVESIETLISKITQQIHALSSKEALIRAKQCVANAACDIDEALNAHCPLFTLPTEILQKIMAFIPDAVLPSELRDPPPIWFIDSYDTAMIIPVSQACRRLRDVALGCPSLWTSIAGCPSALSAIFAQRSRGHPMSVSMPIGRTQEYDLSRISKSLPMNAREIYLGWLYDLDVDADLSTVLRQMFANPLPMLESLSLHFSEDMMDPEGQLSLTVPLTEALAPKLRRLTLYTCDLGSSPIYSSLTHLALHTIYAHHLPAKILSMLSACHALESLYIDQLCSMTDPTGGLIAGPSPPPPGLPTCRRLRRICLRYMYAGFLVPFIESLMAADRPALFLQLLDVRWGWVEPPPGVPPEYCPFHPDGISRLTLGRYPVPYRDHREDPHKWGMSACGARHSLRIAANTLEEAAGALLHDAPHALADVRELWLADVSALIPVGGVGTTALTPAEIAALKAVADMPRLDTVVLANRFQARWARGRPSLFLLPDAREAIAWPGITTLRIVYGYGPFLGRRWTRSEGVPPLNLTLVLEELASGAYDYLEHLVIEVPSHVYVDDEDVVQLRAHFETTQVRVVDETPEMALPEYCVEPAAWPRPSDSPWPYRMW